MKRSALCLNISNNWPAKRKVFEGRTVAEPKKKPSELSDILFYSCAFLGTSVVALMFSQNRVSGFEFSIDWFLRWAVTLCFIAGIPFAIAKYKSENFRTVFILSWLILSAMILLGRLYSAR